LPLKAKYKKGFNTKLKTMGTTEIVEEIERRIESIKKAQTKSLFPISRESIGALAELEDLLEVINESKNN
jgi:hypothetical protein